SGGGGIDKACLLPSLMECADEVFGMMLASVANLVEKCEPDSGQNASQESIDQVVEERITFEATVAFHGKPNGLVRLRCTPNGALDLTRGLLMLEDGDEVSVEDIKDALGECANMLSGTLKTKALDPFGDYTLGTPVIGAHVDHGMKEHLGGLVYQLTSGCTALEVWTDPD
ncbi:MAG: hypothetical protein ACI841_005203, partial [Planctomycetota bacterium]